MTQADGKIVTFYSYKGGTGRTMALANVAWILASNGLRVLTVDWDLDSPGLARFFHPFLDADLFASTSGVIDILKNYARAATRPGPRPDDWYLNDARVVPHAVSLDWRFPGGGKLDIISAGTADARYSTAVAEFRWDNFYARLGGGLFLRAMREDMQRNYDYTLIDSRTGLSDIAGVCTVQFPDTVVNCFTLAGQAIEGAAAVARSIEAMSSQRPIRILPVPMRVEYGEQTKLANGQALARARFAGYPQGMEVQDARRYWGEVEIPYRLFYAYEEILATFGDDPHQTTSLLAAYERLTAAITEGQCGELPPIPEPQRRRVAAMFERKQSLESSDVFLCHGLQDRLWADWVADVLRKAGYRAVKQGTALPPGPDVAGELAQAVRSAGCTVVLLSPSYVRSTQARALWDVLSATEREGIRSSLVSLRVADGRLDPPFDSWNAADIVLQSEEAAAQAVLRALQVRVPGLAAGAVEPEDDNAPEVRYPNARPPVWNVPMRNATFTGRAELLERLRDQVSGGMTVVQAVSGLGGVGKTQLVLEYAHRFMADYELVWWIPAEQEELIDSALADIAPYLGIHQGDNTHEVATAVLKALQRGEPYRKWMLIFDNVEGPDTITEHVPTSTGHVIITSRHTEWSGMAARLEVDVFTAEESVEHLTRRVAGLTAAEAREVSEVVGYLPLAVEMAAAWLESTGMPAEQYIDVLRNQLSQELAKRKAPDYPMTAAATWEVSISRLREQSPAAVRLLELCSCFSPEPIAMRLLYGSIAIEALRPHDPSLGESMELGRVIQEVVRYALIKVDRTRRSIEMHRLVQQVVRDSMARRDPELLQGTYHVVHRILANGRPTEGGPDDPTSWPQLREIWAHLTSSQALECPEEDVRALLVERVRYMWKRGEYQDGLIRARRLEAVWTETQGPDDRQLLFLRFHIGNLLRSLGDVDGARDTDEDVLRRQHEQFGTYHVHALMTAGSLAADFRALGRFEEALAMDRETYRQFKERFGEDDARTLSLANNLAVSMRLVGDVYGALELDQRTQFLRVQVLGPEQPYTLYSAANLARDFREAGDFTSSARWLGEALEDYERVLGADHPDTLRTASSLAVSLRKLGRYEEARKRTEATLSRYELLFPDTPDANACMLNLACDLSATGDGEGALRTARRVLDYYTGKFSDDHPYALAAANNVTIYLRAVGHAVEALDLAERTRITMERNLGPKHPYTLSCSINLANALADTATDAARLEVCAEIERDALAKLRETLRPDHPDILFCAGNHSITLRELGRTVEADRYLRDTLHALESAIGPDHPNFQLVHARHRISRDLEPQPT